MNQKVVDYYTRPSRWDGTQPWVVNTHHRFEVALMSAIRETQTDLTEAEILDVGTADGEKLLKFVRVGARLERCHGVDVTTERIERGKELCPALDLQVASAEDLPFPDETFDLVTQFTCLCNIPDPQPAATEMTRVLRPGGRLLWFDLARTRPTAITHPIPNPADLFPSLRSVWGRPVQHIRAEWVGKWTVVSALAEALPLRKECLMMVFEKPL